MSQTLQTLDYAVLQQCMHCGMCLPTCPTYVETRRERNSPRGRIALMRAVADRELEIGPAFAEEMSYCLGCLACQTACPAGVQSRSSSFLKNSPSSRVALSEESEPWIRLKELLTP